MESNRVRFDYHVKIGKIDWLKEERSPRVIDSHTGVNYSWNKNRKLSMYGSRCVNVKSD